MRRFVRAAATILGCTAITTGLGGQTYTVLHQYKVPGIQANGIAVESASRRLFVATDEGVSVLNADTGEPVGLVQNTKGAHDVLLVSSPKANAPSGLAKGFATTDFGRVIAFLPNNLSSVATINLQAPEAASLCYDEKAGTVAALSAGGMLTTIDVGTAKVVKSGKLPSGTGQIVCGTMNTVYVADPASNVVHVLNDETMKSEGDLPMLSGHKPTGLALDTKGRRLFVSCEDGTIEIIDTDSGFTFIELQGGSGIAHETFAWLPQGKGQWKAAAFVAQQDGTLSGIRMNAYINYSLGGQYKLGPELGAIAFDPKTHQLYLTARRSGSPAVVVAGF